MVSPNLQTQAYLDLPYLVATHRIRAQYDRALQLLQAHEARVTFPVDRFLWHASNALIAAASQQPEVAKVHDQRALEWAAREPSGLRYHPAVGLVTDQYGNVIRKLKALCDAA